MQLSKRVQRLEALVRESGCKPGSAEWQARWADRFRQIMGGADPGEPGCLPLDAWDGEGSVDVGLDCKVDPVLFARRILRQDPWRVQQEILRSVAANPLTAVKSCHASGKTYNAAAVALYFLLRWPQALVITTAPTFRQVKVLWGEIAEARKHCRIALPEPNATELKLGDKRYAVGLSTNDPNKFQSYHAAHVLIIADEAQGILGSIWEAVEGIRAGGDVRVLMQGNPTVTGGPYQDAFTRNRAIWKTFTISAFDTPNLLGVTIEQLMAMSGDELAIAPAPYLVTRQWVKERYIRWGPNHPMYQARVLGEFPEQSEINVYSLAWIERANQEPTPIPNDGKVRPVQVGIDVAGPGDDETVMVARVGGVVIFQQAWSTPDPRGVLSLALSGLRQKRGMQIVAVVVDAVGIGYHVATHLADQKYPVFGFNAGSSPMDPEHFVNAKAEAYWALREVLERGQIVGVTDEEMQAQLAGIRYRHTAAGRVEIESKEEARKRGQSSPDRAEAMVMAFCRVVPRERSMVYGGHYEISPI